MRAGGRAHSLSYEAAWGQRACERGGDLLSRSAVLSQAEEIRSNEEREVVAVEKGGRGDHRGKRSSSSRGCKMMNISMDKGACDVGERPMLWVPAVSIF